MINVKVQKFARLCYKGNKTFSVKTWHCINHMGEESFDFIYQQPESSSKEKGGGKFTSTFISSVALKPITKHHLLHSRSENSLGHTHINFQKHSKPQGNANFCTPLYIPFWAAHFRPLKADKHWLRRFRYLEHCSINASY